VALLSVVVLISSLLGLVCDASARCDWLNVPGPRSQPR